jgi:penicillin-binding protein 1A
VALTMVSMMRGVVEFGTATAARSLGVPLAGKTGTVNDHTDVWFIGYTPTYVTGVWMGYPGKKKPLGNDMTGGVGALPFFIDFMKDFLKDKPKEDFDKAPSMPEDMKELFRQRQRELAAERAELTAEAKEEAGDENATPASTTEPKLEQVTLPPPPKVDEAPPASAPKAETEKPKSEPTPPPSATRPREVDTQKKKGKKGDEP